MHLFKPTVCAATLAAGLLLPTFRASAQDDTAPKGTPSVAAPAAPGAPGGGEQFRQRMNERLKTALKASDDEWSVIEPLLSKVQDKTRDVMMTRFRGMMGGGPGGGGGGRRRGGDNNGGGNAGAAQTEGARPRREGPPPASADATALETALQDDNTNVNDIKTKLAALRAERTKANSDLEAARADLKKVLNMRQEAVLVLAGMLE